MEIHASVTITSPARELRRLKLWSDPVMLADGYSPAGQFMFTRVYQLDDNGQYIGDMSANNVGPFLTHTDMLQIHDMQIADEFTPEQKMAWMTCGGSPSWGCVMRCIGGNAWDTASSVQMVGAVWSGNVVEVLERRSFTLSYNGQPKDIIPMVRIRTFTPADWGKTFETDPHIIHQVYGAGRDGVPFKVHGNVYLPLIQKYASVWTFERWTEEV